MFGEEIVKIRKLRCLKVMFINVYIFTFTIKKFHTKPDDVSRGRKIVAYMY
jgi:hypothetical protein